MILLRRQSPVVLFLLLSILPCLVGSTFDIRRCPARRRRCSFTLRRTTSDNLSRLIIFRPRGHEGLIVAFTFFYVQQDTCRYHAAYDRETCVVSEQ